MTEYIDDESTDNIPFSAEHNPERDDVNEDTDLTPDEYPEEPVVSDYGPSEQEPWAIGVSFRQGGKVYYFAPAGVKARKSDYVLVRTEKGVDIAQVVRILMEDPGIDEHGPIKPLVRKATEADLAQEEELRCKEREAMKLCAVKIAEHGLPMKLVDADYSFDSRSLVFFFSSDGRVDFRELVRDLAKVFRTRIELRQIGVRDEAKMLGGIGSCGRPLCCMTFLRNFDAVGIKVAKDQGLSLNPSKISGVCDRLMCCLRYEHEQYCEMRREAPREGSMVTVPQGRGKVVEVRILTDEVIVELEDGSRVATKTCQVERGHTAAAAPSARQEPKADSKTEAADEPKAKPDDKRRPVREREPKRERRSVSEREPNRERRPVTEREPKRENKPVRDQEPKKDAAPTAKPAQPDAPERKLDAKQEPEQRKHRSRRSSRHRRSSGGSKQGNSKDKNSGGTQGNA